MAEAFNFKWFTRVEQTGNIDKSLNVREGMGAKTGPQTWKYNGSGSGADDSMANLGDGGVANYFLPAYGYLSVGDDIYIYANNTAGYRQVTASDSATLTLAALG